MMKIENHKYRSSYFSEWVHERLPDSSLGIVATDIDMVIKNYKTKKFILLEVKDRKAELDYSQRNIFHEINIFLTLGVKEFNKLKNDTWEYKGFHLIQFEKETFDDGLVYFDRSLIKENDLIRILSF